MCAGLSTLDNLVANGVLNFDADAYVRGGAPRYYGNPFGSQAMPFDQPITPYPYASPYYGGGYAPMLPSQPNVDAFINRHEHSSANSLKELLVYGFAGSLIIYGIHKLNKLGGFFKDKLSKIGTKKSSTVKKEEPKKPEDTKTGGKVKNAAEDVANAARNEGSWFKRNGKKVGGWALFGVAALGALAVLRSMFRKKPQQLSPEQMQMMSQQLEQAQAQPTDPAAAQAQVTAVTPAPVEAAPPVQVAQAPQSQPAPTVEVAQQEPVPEIQPVPPTQA